MENNREDTEKEQGATRRVCRYVHTWVHYIRTYRVRMCAVCRQKPSIVCVHCAAAAAAPALPRVPVRLFSPVTPRICPRSERPRQCDSYQVACYLDAAIKPRHV